MRPAGLGRVQSGRVQSGRVQGERGSCLWMAAPLFASWFRARIVASATDMSGAFGRAAVAWMQHLLHGSCNRCAAAA